MTVSDSDREYMRRIGAYKALSHAEAAAVHASRDLGERLRASWDLFLRHRGELRPADRQDDPLAFYEKARALGLYLP